MKRLLTPHHLLAFVFLLVQFTAGALSPNQKISGCSPAPFIEEMGALAVDNPCYSPAWLQTTNITQNSATWDWESVYGAMSYSVQWRYPGGYWNDLPGGPFTQTWVNVYDLQPCTSYEWRVRSNCGYGYYSPWSYSTSFTTLCNYCEVPSGLYTNNITDNSATFHWNEVWGAVSYSIQIRSTNGYWETLPGSPFYGSWANAYNLQPATNYEWRIKTSCNNSWSSWSYPVPFTTNGYYYCQHPDWMQTTNITENSAIFKWNSVYGAESYSIEYRTSGGWWSPLPGGPFYGTWVNVWNLQPCTTYEWRIRSNCHYGSYSTWSYGISFTTLCNSCPVPYGLYALDITQNSAKLKWSAVYGAESYSVQMKDHYGNWVEVPGSPTSGTWIGVWSLSPCTSYEWRVRANCHYGNYSYWSKQSWFTTSCEYSCHAPEWVYTGGVTQTSAVLHWEQVSGATAYIVEWRQGGAQSWTTLIGGPFTQTYTELNGLESHTSYEWRVKAVCYNGQYSGYSSITWFTTLGSSCGFPFWRYTSPVTDTSATFNWDVVTEAESYTVQYRKVNDVWMDVNGSPTTDTKITAHPLTPNTYYEWRMRVNCKSGAYSNWTSAIAFYTGSVQGCDTPVSLYTDNISLTAATLNWSEVSGALSYSVEFRLLPNGAWNPVPGSPVDSNAVTLDGLTPFATYEWRVRANCPNGNHSFWTLTEQFTTTNAPPCNAPSGLSVSNITETTAQLSWLPVSGAQGYTVQTRLPNGTWVDLPANPVMDTTALATGFTPNTTYEWRVRTNCGSGQFSNWSALNSFATIGNGPGNDNCDSAMLLTVETDCTPTYASNVDASASNPPPVGGCPSNGYKDVWFKFTMPDVPNPTVTIRTTLGSLANAVMEVYTGADCNIMSFIACEDDNDNGNGSSMPVINLTGSPNATIWVRVWGLDGATGTFSICVFDHISVNFQQIPETVDPEAGETIQQQTELQPRADLGVELPQLHVAPNPVSDVFYMTVQQTESTQVTGWALVDLSGRSVVRQQVSSTTDREYRKDIDVSGLAQGIYMLQVTTTSGILTERISVVK